MRPGGAEAACAPVGIGRMRMRPDVGVAERTAVASGEPDRRPQRSLAWLCVEDLSTCLDAATYLETTARLRAAGWRVLLVCAGEPGVRALRGVEVRCLSRSSTYVLGHMRWHVRALRSIARERPEIVLVHQDSLPYALLWRFAQRLRGRRRPLLVMDTRTVPMTRVTWKAKVRAWFFAVTQWCANRFADGQTAITPRMAAAIGIPARQLLGVWPSGVDRQRFEGVARRRGWPGRGDPVDFVYIGALWRERHLLELAQAVVAAARRGARARLTLIGEGPQRAELEAFATTTDGVVRVGSPVSYAAIPDALGDAHVGVLPFPDEAIFRVSSPIKLFEYLAAGLPVLATRIPCHTDVLGESDAVFWAEDATPAGLRAAVERVWGERARLPALGALAREAAGAFDWSASAAALDVALRRLLPSAKR